MTAAIEVTVSAPRRACADAARPQHACRQVHCRPDAADRLELKGGGEGRVLCFTFIPLARKLLPALLDDLVAALKGRSFGYEEAAAVHDAGEKRLTHIGHEGLAKMALSMFDMAVHDALRARPAYPSRAARRQGGAAADLQQLRPRPHGAARRRARPRSWWPSTAASPTSSCAWAASGRPRVRRVPGGARCRGAGRGDLVRLQSGAFLGDRARDLPRHRWAGPCLDRGAGRLRRLRYAGAARDQARHADPDRENWWSWRVGKAAIEMGACDYHAGPAAHRRRHRLDAARARGPAPYRSLRTCRRTTRRTCVSATPTRHWLEFMDWGQHLWPIRSCR